MKTKITIEGSKRDGYVLKIQDEHSLQDIAIHFLELREIIKVLEKTIKKHE